MRYKHTAETKDKIWNSKGKSLSREKLRNSITYGI